MKTAGFTSLSRTAKLAAAILGLGPVAIVLAAVGATAGLRVQLALFGASVLLWLAVVADWKQVVFFVLLWLLIEALPRRYLIDEPALTLAKDALLGLAYAKALWSLHRSGGFSMIRLHPLLWTVLLMLSSWVIVQLFNPLLPSLYLGLLGLRAWLWWLPLLLLAPLCFHSKDELFAFVRRYVSLSIPLCLLGGIQLFVGRDHILNRNYLDFEITYEFPVSVGVNLVRAISTFASNGIFAQYLFFIIFLTFVLLQAKSAQIGLLQRTALMIALPVGLVSNAGSTVPMLAGILLPTMMVVGGGLRGTARALLPLALFAAVAGAALYVISPAMIRSATARIVSPLAAPRSGMDHSMNALDRAERAMEAVLLGLNTAPLGHGVGSASLGAQYVLGGRQRASELAPIEGGFARIAWETGVVGLLVFLLLEGFILWQLLRQWCSLRDQELRWMALAIACCHVGTLGWSLFASIVDSATFAILLWFLTGVGLRLDRWDTSKQYSPVVAAA